MSDNSDNSDDDLCVPPDRPNCKRGVLLLRGTLQLTGLRTATSLKYKAQRNVEFPIVPTFF